MLSNQVKEIMTTQLTSVKITETISRVVEMMVTADVGRVIITDADVPVVGAGRRGRDGPHGDDGAHRDGAAGDGARQGRRGPGHGQVR